MNKSKIEWCDMTWNPVTGCLHRCAYCYARGIARRYGGEMCETRSGNAGCVRGMGAEERRTHDLSEPSIYLTKMGDETKAPYPYGFDPTLHRYRLGEPAAVKKPQRIFVCSMADLFGEWVPDTWIEMVFVASMAAPQHKYLFLTKNPARFQKLAMGGKLPCEQNFWYGSTITTMDDEFYYDKIGGGMRNRFLSIEPVLGPFERFGKLWTDWAIIGAETGGRKNKVIPQRKWIENIVHQCRLANIPVFMKNSLADIWGEPLIQEWPEGLR